MNLVHLVLIFPLVALLQTSSSGQTAKHDSVLAKRERAIEIHRSNAEEAYHLLEISLALAEEINYKRGEYSVYEALGYLNFLDERIEDAVEAYQKSVDLATEMDSALLLGYGIQHLGNTYLRLGRLEKAKVLMNEAYQIFVEENDVSEQSRAIGTLGSINMELGDYKNALQYLSRAGALSDSIGDVRGRAVANSNLAHLYLIQGMGEEALPFIRADLQYRKEVEHLAGIAMAHGNLGIAFSLMGDSSRAFQNYQLCLDSAKAHGWKRIEYDTYKDMSDTYSKYGDHKRALEFFQKHHELKNSVIGMETQERIADLEVKFETKEKERQIEVLEQKQRISKLRIGLLVGGVSFGTIVALFIIIGLRVRIKKNQALLAKSKEIHRLEKELVETELRKKEEELVYKSRYLTEFALDIEQKTKLSEVVKEQLNSIIGLPP